jgi:hypothetical protein
MDEHSEARDRKNSAVEFDGKKTTHKPVTPTRVSSKLKSKKSYHMMRSSVFSGATPCN